MFDMVNYFRKIRDAELLEKTVNSVPSFSQIATRKNGEICKEAFKAIVLNALESGPKAGVELEVIIEKQGIENFRNRLRRHLRYGKDYLSTRFLIGERGFLVWSSTNSLEFDADEMTQRIKRCATKINWKKS